METRSSLRSGSPGMLTLRIPWDPLTARGFLIAVALHIAAFFLVLHVRWDPQPPSQPEVAAIPIELLTLGWGEGEKPAGGDLIPEGVAYRAKSHRAILAEASLTRFSPSAEPSSANLAQGIPRPVSEVPTKALAAPGMQQQTVLGTPDGTREGNGLGQHGTGSGKGLGFDIEWGGGGNRIVLSRVLPQYPRGHNVSGRVRLRFTVLPDGTVGSILPIQRSDPLLERAAIEALRQWRFNPLSTSVEMIGIITFTFELE